MKTININFFKNGPLDFIWARTKTFCIDPKIKIEGRLTKINSITKWNKHIILTTISSRILHVQLQKLFDKQLDARFCYPIKKKKLFQARSLRETEVYNVDTVQYFQQNQNCLPRKFPIESRLWWFSILNTTRNINKYQNYFHVQIWEGKYVFVTKKVYP